MKGPIDIFMTSYLREEFTRKTFNYLKERTKHPYRLTLINNGGNEGFLIDHAHELFLAIDPGDNLGIHAAWNIALALAQSEYFITTDNDIYAPDLDPDWLTQLIALMDERPDYGAISLCPHVFIGAVGIPVDHPDDVVERNMCGAVLRIMRREAVWKAGGWEKVVRTGRNHEERTICSRLQNVGYKVGICSRIRAYHPFSTNWGYPPEFTPEMQGHNPDLDEYVQQFDKPEHYNEKTWMKK